MNERKIDLQLCPMVGHKRILSPIYLDYHFISSGYSPKMSFGHLVELPTVKGEEFEILIHFIDEKQLLVKTLKNNRPFVMNGCMVYEAELKMGDQLIFGHNVVKIIERKIDTEIQKNEKSMEAWSDLTQQFLSSPLHLLIEGETGTGKTRFAKWIFEQNSHFKKWCHVNLASYAPSLIESELFGHIKGSFTGAHSDKKGALEDAHQGLLFLDEIDSLPMEIQVKLLLFLDDQTLRPVGSNISKKLKIKIIFASGRPLQKLVESNLMRRDFYFRLSSGHHMQLPSLRSQKSLILEYVLEFCHEHFLRCSDTLLEFYQHFPWPGNYRQLKDHLLKKKFSSQKSRLDYDRLDEMLTHSPNSVQVWNETLEVSKTLPTLDEVKQLYGQKIYQLTGGHWEKTADILGISTKTVKSMISVKAS